MLSAVELLGPEMKRLHTMLDGTIAGLTPEQLHAIPGGHPGANTLAWGLWHVVRTEDNIVRFVVQNRRPTVWVEGGYPEKLGLHPAAQGTGMSLEEARALRIADAGVFREYMQKVWASTDELLGAADPALVDRTITIRGMGDMPVVMAVARICLSHGMTHFGEMELARLLVGAGPVTTT